MMAKIAVLFSVLFLLSVAPYADNSNSDYSLKSINDEFYLFKIPSGEWKVDSCGKTCLKRDVANQICAIDSFKLVINAKLERFDFDTLGAVLAARDSGVVKNDEFPRLIKRINSENKIEDRSSYLPKVADIYPSLYKQRIGKTLFIIAKDDYGLFKFSWMATIFFLLLAMAAGLFYYSFLVLKSDAYIFITAIAWFCGFFSFFAGNMNLVVGFVAVCYGLMSVVTGVIAVSSADMNKKGCIILGAISLILAICIFLSEGYGWRFILLASAVCLAASLLGYLIRIIKKPEDREPTRGCHPCIP